MELRQIETFIRVASLGSYSQAAISLGIAQSSVSARVSSLEKELGRLLFYRVGNRIQMTAEGEDFLALAERVAGLVASAKDVSSTDVAVRTPLRLGANHTAAGTLMPAIIEAYLRSQPDHRKVDAVVDSTRGLMTRMMEGSVEFAFVNQRQSHSKCLIVSTYVTRMCLVASVMHSLAGRHVTINEVAKRNFISYEVGPATRELQRLALRANGELPIAVSTNSTSLAQSLVQENVGLCFLPHASISALLAREELAEVRIRGYQPRGWMIALVKWKGRAVGREGGRFLEALADPSLRARLLELGIERTSDVTG